MIAPGIAETLLPIDLLKANEEASVVELSGDAKQIHQLAEIGLRVGCSIRMVCPGYPCVLAVDGRRLSVRLNHEVDVLVSTSY